LPRKTPITNQPAAQTVSGKASARIEKLLAEALASHRGGNLPQAERRYADILKIEDANPQVLTLLGTLRAQQGKFKEAVRLLGRSLKIDHRQPFALNSLGNALHAMKRHDEAVVQYERAIVLKPDHVAYANRGNALMALNRHAEALASFDKAIALDASYVEAHSKRGDALRQCKRYDESIASYDKALTLRPDSWRDHFNKGVVLQESGRHLEAIASYDRAVALKADFAEAYNNRGNVLADVQRLAEALQNYDKAIDLRPDYAEPLNNRGNVLAKLQRSDSALASYEEAIRVKPDYAQAHNNCANLLRALHRPAEALAHCEKAIALQPDYAEAFIGRGVALQDLKRPIEALASFDQAIAVDPENPDAHRHRGNVLKHLKRHREAIGSYDKTIKLRPGDLDAHHGRSLALYELRRSDEALASIDRAIALGPDNPGFHHNRSFILVDLKRFDEALASIDTAIGLDPEFPYALGQRLEIKLQMCNWDAWQETRDGVVSAVERGSRASIPFSLFGATDRGDIHQKCAELYVSDKFPPRVMSTRVQAQRSPSVSQERIRVAYLSADFRNHATSHLMAGVFEHHDRKRFEIYAISFGRDDGSAMRARLNQSFEHLVDVRDMRDSEVAELLREREIDIVVDLKGFTRDCRPGILSYRPAPIQINYLGFPGTMGASYVDYIIADRIVLPENEQRFYSEKPVYLPDTYQCNDSRRRISERPLARAEAGLPDDEFVFCSFNHNYKINPEMFDVWMRTLQRMEGSVLWLLRSNPAAERNLRQEAERRGVSGSRLIFAPVLAHADHLARLRLADLFLDTLPCGAHTSASDALWAGLPVLTCWGGTFAGRVASSLLNAIGLPELVTESLDEYEARSLALAHDRALLADIKAKLARNRETHPLFDTVRFTRHLEAAYTRMVDGHRSGEPPAAFAVEAVDDPHG
jgi:predicted O-linked N-acetylglucosamine transferase (SPINDLY family)